MTTTKKQLEVDVAAEGRMKEEEGTPTPLQIAVQVEAANKVVAMMREVELRVEGIHDVQSSDVNGTLGSWSTAWKWLMQQIQVECANETTASQLEKTIKRLSNYALKALCFALLILSAYLVQQYTSALFTTGESLSFLIALVLFLVIDATIFIRLTPNCSNVLVCISWFFLELALCILIISCNGYYGFAILTMLLLIIAVHVAFLQPKLQHVLSCYDGDTSTQNQQDIDDQHLDNLFELSQLIANSGSLLTAFFERYVNMAGPVNAARFFFFCTIALSLYMMMAITLRAVSRPHATCLAIALMVLLFITVITASIQVDVQGSGTTPQAVNYNHRKILIML